MTIKVINNRKVKRQFSNGLWYRKGIMFPSENSKYLQIGFFGIIILLNFK